MDVHRFICKIIKNVFLLEICYWLFNVVCKKSLIVGNPISGFPADLLDVFDRECTLAFFVIFASWVLMEEIVKLFRELDIVDVATEIGILCVSFGMENSNSSRSSFK